MKQVTVRELYIYPVKGCGGGPVEKLEITELGIVGDREYAFAGEDGFLVDQKKTPLLASIKAELDGPGLVLRHANEGRLQTCPSLRRRQGAWQVGHRQICGH